MLELTEQRISLAAAKAADVIAERVRIERVELFKRIISAEKALRAMIGHYADKIALAVEEKGDDPKNARRVHEIIHEQTVLLRASMRIWLNAALRDAAKMGFRHMGDAMLPIFKDNREAYEREFIADRALFEAKLSFALKVGFAARAKPTMTAVAQADNVARILKRITKKNVAGLNPSERVWDLTVRAEQDLKRIVTNGMAAGENPATVARRIKKYVMPAPERASKFGVEFGPGVYRSPYRNAMRLARTEMNKTYVKSQATFLKGKSWVVAATIVTSPAHSDYDVCDELAALPPMPVEDAEEKIPAHPHCGCSIRPIIDPKVLGEDEAA